MVPSYDSLYHSFFALGGIMEYDMVEVWKFKLKELEFQKEMMLKDKQFTKKEIADIDEMIESARTELKKAIIEKSKEDGKNNKSR